jgi:hypothetical protein
MPVNFPEIWVKRVKLNLNQNAAATFLEGIPEMDVNITELGAGSASESNVIHIPISNFKPEVLINNTTYPIALQAYSDEESIVKLDKYQTKVTTLTDDQVIGAAYDRIDAATKPHTIEINAKKYAKALHALAPDTNTATTKVLATSGADDGTGRKRMAYADLVAVKKAMKGATDPRIVLSDDHYNDLLLDRANFGDKLVNYNSGEVAPKIAGLKIYTYSVSPLYDNTGAKKPFDSVRLGTDKEASVFFDGDNVAKKTGMTKQYFAKAGDDPENQVNKINYRHYFIAVPVEKKLLGAII